MIRLLLCLIAFSPLTLFANQNVISVVRVVPHSFELAFPNERNIEPELSDFHVKNFVLMSNENGERFTVVTIQNLANGSRTLNHKHLMAQVSNGARIRPLAFEQMFKDDETLSLTIQFGESHFPLLTVYSRTKG
ncbi:hypothetical protein [Pseudoalteromonas spongiae]|uniref:Uncharacterized protein n=1 Tax=Pseudoalteromonas spongiae TaxID=298657 RepID=A0ABU8EYG3_9GAMM